MSLLVNSQAQQHQPHQHLVGVPLTDLGQFLDALGGDVLAEKDEVALQFVDQVNPVLVGIVTELLADG
ncbi:MAG: hypothetical protein ACFB8W_08145 [Elainellaceae cyanobacterium]